MVSPLTFGIILQLGAFFLFATMDTAAKWLAAAAIPAIQVAFLRYAVHFGWVLALYLPRQGGAVFSSATPRLQVLRGVSLLLATVLNFTALTYLPLATAISILFAAPLVVCLLSVPVLGEKVGVRRLAAVLAGLFGVLVIVDPWGERFDRHMLLSVGAMLSLSIYFVLTRRIAGIDSNAVTQCYTAGVATLALAVPSAFLWVWPSGAMQWASLLMIGSFGMLGHSMVTRAHEHVEASVLAPMIYSQILYATLFGWLLFDSVPDARTALGVLIIVASGLYVWLRERRLALAADATPARAPADRGDGSRAPPRDLPG